jgi:hypothetical protein
VERIRNIEEGLARAASDDDRRGFTGFLRRMLEQKEEGQP